MALALIYQRWSETIGSENNASAFKQRCALYSIDETDELRIRELEHEHGKSIVSMIKGNLEQSITHLGKLYGYSTKERVKWSQFFLGSKIIYESICPECNKAHIHYSKNNASVICEICKNPRCINCGEHYFDHHKKSLWTQEKCCSQRCLSKVQKNANNKTHMKRSWIFKILKFLALNEGT